MLIYSVQINLFFLEISPHGAQKSLKKTKTRDAQEQEVKGDQRNIFLWTLLTFRSIYEGLGEGLG